MLRRNAFVSSTVIHQIGAFAPHVWKHVAIQIQRRRDLGVAENVLHDFRMGVLGQQEGGAAVPLVMETHGRKPGFLQEILEALADVGFLEWLAISRYWHGCLLCYNVDYMDV